MAATLTLDTITSSGSEIEIPTGKTLVIADAGALKINNVAITTGAQGVISKTAAYTILAADFTGKSSLIVFVNVGSGTDTETIITLPAAADFGTCAIHIISTTAHGSGNKITIKNSSAVEQYTLYAKGDHCELVSDTTNIFRTGNEFCTVLGVVYLTTQQYIGANGRLDVFAIGGSSSYNVEADIGKGWSTVTHDYTVPQTGYYVFDGITLPTTGSYVNGWQIYNVTQVKEYNYLNAGWNMAYGNSDQLGWPMHATKGDVLTFWVSIHSTGTYVLGGSGNAQGSKLGWHLLRRD
jgi:hypothetical protein